MVDNLAVWIAVIVAIIAAAASVTSAIINRNGTRQSRREPSWNELVGRLSVVEDELEEMKRLEGRKMGAVARIFKAIDRQWPTPHGPDIDPDDITLIEDTIPPRWLRRPPASAQASMERG